MSSKEREPDGATSLSEAPPVRLHSAEDVILALRRTSWVATFSKIVTLGLFIPWWRAGWFVVTDLRLIVRYGILNKSEIALPLHFVQDASVHRSWLGVGRVYVSTAGGGYSNLRLYPLKAGDARRLADTIISQARRVALDHRSPRQGTDDTTEALARLGELRDKGVLTEDEFAQQKARLLQSKF